MFSKKFKNALPGVSNDQASKHRSDSGSRPGHSDGGGSGADKLGSCVDVTAHRTGLEAP